MREVGDAMRSPEERDGAVGVFVQPDGRAGEVGPERAFRDLQAAALPTHAVVVADLAGHAADDRARHLFGAERGELDRVEEALDETDAAVDERRTTSALADAITAESFDDAKASEAGQDRVKSAERLRDAVVRALKQIHALLDDEQRRRLAYLLRTGTLSI